MIRINKELLDYFNDLYVLQTFNFVEKESFSVGNFLIHQNKKGNDIFIIKTGITKCFVNEENGRDFIQEFFGEGEILGEIEIFTETLSFSNVIALTDVTAYKIDKKNFYKLLDTNKDLNLIIIRALATKIRDTAIRTSQQQVHPLDYNLKRLLRLISDQKINFSKQDLADYLGITLRSLNRSLKKS